ncbi:hypothetical protein ACFSHT_22550 [Paraburkholderia silviterrae]|uniref:Uncharacterized protein n=1 Tax=Paraburkholderia silviterrae TaxID=2528715 RepID=A0A4R5MF20_9BURK|nr:hypothetical protein [Paraburkholderia silviterrae]TDG25839.1 hypothetical protein EYW47_00260 [Paraburkholderia silviterrae]
MKKIFAALLALVASVAFGATLSPITLLNPSGSTAGQAIVSNGTSSAPAWGAVSSIAGGAVINGVAGSYRTLGFATSGSLRWIVGENADTESGGNAGSNFYLQSATDAGAPSTVEMQFQRNSSVLLIGLTSRVTLGDLQYANIQDAGAGSFAGGVPAFMQYSNDTSSSGIFIYKSRSATKGVSAVVQNGDDIGEVDFEPDGGSGPVKAAFINSVVDSATISTTSVPARLVFWTMPVGGAFPLERARITNSGRILVNTTTDDGTDYLQVNGSVLTAGLTTSNGLSVTGGSINGVPGRLLNVQVFSSSGTYTPTSGATSIIVRVQAPGGGSGGAASTTASQVAVSGGGNGGSYAEVRYTSVSTQTVTIGAVGAAGAAGANAGGTGGTTSFGSLVSCPGGNGGGGGAAVSAAGVSGSAPTPNLACTISGGTTIDAVTGGRGQGGYALTGTTGFLGAGGNSAMGVGYVSAGGAQTGYGLGSGAGAQINGISAGNVAGAAGAAGEIIVYEYQ